MSYVVICGVACAASALTFFSGFGLGTLLLPAFAWFVPVEQAVALTAVVHLLNGVFKLLLVGRHADREVLLRFGLPAVAAAFGGAVLGSRLLPKLTLVAVQRVVAAMLAAVEVGMMTGLL